LNKRRNSTSRKHINLPVIRRPRVAEETLSAYLFLAPTLLHLVVFTAFPVLFALYLSFQSWNLATGANYFVGFANYAELVQDEAFHQSLGNTAYFTATVLVSVLVVSLGTALLLNQALPARKILRSISYMPAVTSVIAIAGIWTWLLEPTYGPVNTLLATVGIEGPRWLSNTETALPSLILVSIWRTFGYFALIFLAGLQAIDPTYYEAAQIDGAGELSLFRHITLPLLAPTTLFVSVMVVIGSFQVFGLVYATTGGGPVGATNVLVFFLYQQVFLYFQMGYGAAAAYVLFGIVFVATLVQLRLGRGMTPEQQSNV
jgi:multiple sugar transport system permease protein